MLQALRNAHEHVWQWSIFGFQTYAQQFGALLLRDVTAQRLLTHLRIADHLVAQCRVANALDQIVGQLAERRLVHVYGLESGVLEVVCRTVFRIHKARPIQHCTFVGCDLAVVVPPVAVVRHRAAGVFSFDRSAIDGVAGGLWQRRQLLQFGARPMLGSRSHRLYAAAASQILVGLIERYLCVSHGRVQCLLAATRRGDWFAGDVRAMLGYVSRRRRRHRRLRMLSACRHGRLVQTIDVLAMVDDEWHSHDAAQGYVQNICDRNSNTEEGVCVYV